MKIECVTFYGAGNIPILLPDAHHFVRREYNNVDEIVKILHEFVLSNPQIYLAWAFLSHGRFLLVTRETFDLHLHGQFNNL